MLLVAVRPDGLAQVRVIVSPTGSGPGCRSGCWVCLLAWPLTAVMTAPPVIPSAAAGLPQMTPSTRVPEVAGAIWAGTARLV